MQRRALRLWGQTPRPAVQRRRRRGLLRRRPRRRRPTSKRMSAGGPLQPLRPLASGWTGSGRRRRRGPGAGPGLPCRGCGAADSRPGRPCRGPCDCGDRCPGRRRPCRGGGAAGCIGCAAGAAVCFVGGGEGKECRCSSSGWPGSGSQGNRPKHPCRCSGMVKVQSCGSKLQSSKQTGISPVGLLLPQG